MAAARFPAGKVPLGRIQDLLVEPLARYADTMCIMDPYIVHNLHDPSVGEFLRTLLSFSKADAVELEIISLIKRGKGWLPEGEGNKIAKDLGEVRCKGGEHHAQCPGVDNCQEQIKFGRAVWNSTLEYIESDIWPTLTRCRKLTIWGVFEEAWNSYKKGRATARSATSGPALVTEKKSKPAQGKHDRHIRFGDDFALEISSGIEFLGKDYELDGTVILRRRSIDASRDTAGPDSFDLLRKEESAVRNAESGPYVQTKSWS
jgi:hypothetical protein